MKTKHEQKAWLYRDRQPWCAFGREPTPTIQLQHFLQADATGGESTLVDGFKLAADLRAQAPEKFNLLANVPLYFHFRDASAELENEGPVIELNVLGEVSGIRYSNHAVQPFLLQSCYIERDELVSRLTVLGRV